MRRAELLPVMLCSERSGKAKTMKAKLITADGMTCEVNVQWKDRLAYPTEIRQRLHRRHVNIDDIHDPISDVRDRRYVFDMRDQNDVPVYREKEEQLFGTDVIREAFFLGFMVSREGFCSECMVDDLAPQRLQPENGTVAQARAECVGSMEFVRLRELAVERIVRAKSF